VGPVHSPCGHLCTVPVFISLQSLWSPVHSVFICLQSLWSPVHSVVICLQSLRLFVCSPCGHLCSPCGHLCTVPVVTCGRVVTIFLLFLWGLYLVQGYAASTCQMNGTVFTTRHQAHWRAQACSWQPPHFTEHTGERKLAPGSRLTSLSTLASASMLLAAASLH